MSSADILDQYEAHEILFTLPRPLALHQRVILNELIGYQEGRNQYRTFILNWHRRGRKDDTCLNCIKDAAYRKPGDYLYVMPTALQAKSVMLQGWDDAAGMTRIDLHFPYPSVRTNQYYESSRIIKLENGSRIKFIGADDVGQRGGGYKGIICSEFSQADFRPFITGTTTYGFVETKGWLIINSTPNGKNYFYDTYQQALRQPDTHFVSTLPASKSGLYSEEQLMGFKQDAIDRAGGNEREGMLDYAREMECSFELSGIGQIYEAEQLKQCTTRVSFNTEHPLYVALDLGYRDATAAVFFQFIDNQWNIIADYESWGQSTEQYIQDILMIAPVKPTAILPWDGSIKKDNAIKSHADIYRNHGFRVIQLKSADVLDSIYAVRRELSMMRIDSVACIKLLNALNNYNWKKDPNNAHPSRPEHSQYSHLADAFRYMVAAKEQLDVPDPIIELPRNERFYDISASW